MIRFILLKFTICFYVKFWVKIANLCLPLIVINPTSKKCAKSAKCTKSEKKNIGNSNLEFFPWKWPQENWSRNLWVAFVLSIQVIISSYYFEWFMKKRNCLTCLWICVCVLVDISFALLSLSCIISILVIKPFRNEKLKFSFFKMASICFVPFHLHHLFRSKQKKKKMTHKPNS